ncbi:MAG: S41 family peptidase, partial [Parvularculaceae bacterium]|nr:S41 family peptidase [Parvularculaceae bacterium]
MRIFVWAAGAVVGLLLLAAALGLGAYFLNTCTPPMTAAPSLPASTAEAEPLTRADGAVDWRAHTLVDLAAASRQLWENTPIPFDAENDRYRRWAIEGFVQAEQRAAAVVDRAGYFFTLSAYINGFQDPHVAVYLKGDPLPTRWPGFLVSADGEGARVVAVDPALGNAPPVGAKIVGCDGAPIAALLAEKIFPYRYNPALVEDRRTATTRLFLDRGNPFAPPLARCSFEMGGRTTETALDWRAAPGDDAWWARVADAGAGARAEWGVSSPAPGVAWIGVPTFSSGEETSPKLDALIKEVAAKGDAMRAGRAIVIDTRGNGGGNSWYADRLAEAVFTKPVLKAHGAPPRKEATDWRGSVDNAAYWKSEAERQKAEFGRFSLNRLGSMFLSWRLGESAKETPPIWRTGLCKTDPAGGLTTMRPKGASPFPAKGYFLSNGSCGSSCLNFA